MTIKVITSEKEKVTVQTFHPVVEVKRAKATCDAIAAGKGSGWRDNEIHTVSPDATAMYAYYGRNVLGLDIHFFVDDRETDIEGMFASFNKAYDVIERYGVDKS